MEAYRDCVAGHIARPSKALSLKAGLSVLRVRGVFDGFQEQGTPDLICDCRSSLGQPEGQGWVDPRPYAGISEHPCLVKAARTEPTRASPTCLSSSAHVVHPACFRVTMLSRLTPLPPERTPKRGGHPISSSVGWTGT